VEIAAPDLDKADFVFLDVLVEARLQLGPIACLNDEHRKGNSSKYLFDEAHSGRLVEAS
jgi:hypothetical protein